ncbi:FtsH protease activity modulator HflK [Clostridiaceae bacterium HSG29]|nr:FtsH protease activity modulator HflK [Clostridiaceae bacterium HSG29]
MKNNKAKGSLSFFLLIIVVLAIFAGFNSYYTLENAEQAVIERFGEVVNIVNEPGLNFKVPFIEKVYKVNTNEINRIQYGYVVKTEAATSQEATYNEVLEESIALTKGSYLVNVGAVIQYKITNAADYIYNVQDPNGTIKLAFESVLRRNLQNMELNDALVNKDTISTQIIPDLAKKINEYNFGITITDVKFTDVLLPAEVQFAYDDVNNAKNEKTEYSSQALEYENDKIPQARAKAYETIESAKAYRVETIAQAKGDVAKFTQVLEKYELSKNITRTRMYIETMNEILAKTPNKYIIDLSDSSNTIKYLPLNPESLNKGGNQ